jgi:hypothetical protein
VKKSISHYLIGVVASGGAMLSLVATANPPGVPVADPAPLSCSTLNYSISAVTGGGGEFPVVVQCNAGTCSEFKYDVVSLFGKSISQTLFAVSGDQDLVSTTPSAFVASPGVGDSTTGFLSFAQHEYPVRFNANSTVFQGTILIKGKSAPRIGTVYIRSGKIDESCLIAAPGVPGNPFTPLTETKSVVAAGGKCAATLHYNSAGKVTNITLPPNSPCFAGKIPNGAKAAIGGEPIQDVNAPDGITFGDGTTTVYLPSGWAICTAAPCPGTVTYVFTR